MTQADLMTPFRTAILRLKKLVIDCNVEDDFSSFLDATAHLILKAQGGYSNRWHCDWTDIKAGARPPQGGYYLIVPSGSDKPAMPYLHRGLLPHFKPHIVELCAGTGILSAGVSFLSWEVAVAIDDDSSLVETYRLNRPETSVACANIAHSLKSLIPRNSILIAGLPCQPYSRAGLRKGLQDPRA